MNEPYQTYTDKQDRKVDRFKKDDFWDRLDHLIAVGDIVIDRPKGSHHPTCPNSIYLMDYGYLEGTLSADGAGIDI